MRTFLRLVTGFSTGAALAAAYLVSVYALKGSEIPTGYYIWTAVNSAVGIIGLFFHSYMYEEKKD